MLEPLGKPHLGVSASSLVEPLSLICYISAEKKEPRFGVQKFLSLILLFFASFAAGLEVPTATPTASFRSPLQTYLRLELEGHPEIGRNKWVTLFSDPSTRSRLFTRAEEILTAPSGELTESEKRQLLWQEGQRRLKTFWKNTQRQITRYFSPPPPKDVCPLEFSDLDCECLALQSLVSEKFSKSDLLRLKLIVFLLWDYTHLQKFKVSLQGGHEAAIQRFHAEFPENFEQHLNLHEQKHYAQMIELFWRASEIYFDLPVTKTSEGAAQAIYTWHLEDTAPGSTDTKITEYATILLRVHWTPENRVALIRYLLDGADPTQNEENSSHVSFTPTPAAAPVVEVEREHPLSTPEDQEGEKATEKDEWDGVAPVPIPRKASN
jgi:hypothetical protein